MLKIKSILHVEVKGRDYEFSCLPDSPLDDLLDANSQINAFILGRKEQAKAIQNSESPQETQPEVKTE